jgi:glycosyltransferase involved in cell wall biosynthesis
MSLRPGRRIPACWTLHPAQKAVVRKVLPHHSVHRERSSARRTLKKWRFNVVHMPDQTLPPPARFGKVVPFTTFHLGKDELATLYQNSSALVFPSLMEGFGYPPVEALECGTPCVISNESAVAEIVGDAGLKVNPRSPEEIAGAMMAVLRGEAPDVRERGRHSLLASALPQWPIILLGYECLSGKTDGLG